VCRINLRMDPKTMTLVVPRFGGEHPDPDKRRER
jgi:hypothetical protein